MDRQVFSILLICLMGLAGNFSHAQESAAPHSTAIVISSGQEGGGYWNAGSRLQRVANDMGFVVQNVSSVGSINNLRNLLDKNSQVSLAFAQADALQAYLGRHPDATQAIETLADLGNECVFIISNAEGDLSNLEDMVDSPRLHLGIKSASSGSRVTWTYMTTLVPGLKDNITIAYGDTVGMMTDLAHPLTDIDRAVMIVQEPNARSPEIDMVIAHPDRFQFVEINDGKLTSKTSNGEAIYQSLKVKPGAVEGARAVKTICVRGLLLANKNKLTAAQRNSLSELIKTHWAQVNTATK